MSHECERCGATLGPGAPEGLCPRCLLAGALDAGTGPGVLAVLADPGAAPEDLALAVEARLPDLEIGRLLGRGGMGFVFEARQRGLDRKVAVKVVPNPPDGDASRADRFLAEARALARLDHPGIVAVHASGRAEGFLYLVMEHVEGQNLRQRLRGGPLGVAESLRLAAEVATALAAAHAQGIIHRDVKPENILLDRDGRAKVADLGIARVLEPTTTGADVERLTASRHRLGTPLYMAPEQVTRPQDVDARADLYSLGVVLYEMLTNDLPLGRFPLPSERGVGGAELDACLLRLLAHDPAQRPAGARDVARELQGFADRGRAAAASVPSSTVAPMARPAVAEPAADAAVAPSASEFDLMIARHAVVWYPLAAAVVGLVAFVTAVLAMSLDSDYTSLYVWNGRADFGRLLGASLVQAVAVGGVLVAHRWCRARPLWTAALAIFVVVAHVVPALLVAPPWHNRQAWVLGQLTATSVFQAAALLTFRSLTLAWFRLRHGSPGVAASPFEERIREAPVLWAVISLTILGFLVVLTWGLTMLVWGDFTRPYFGFGVRDSPGRVFMATCLQAYAVVLALYALARLRGRGMARVGLILFVLAVHAFFAMGVVSPNEQAPMLGLLLARSIWIGALFLLVLAGLRRMAGAPRGA